MPAAAQLPASLRDLTLDAFPGFAPTPLRLGLGALTRLTRLTLLGHSDHLSNPAWHTCAVTPVTVSCIQLRYPHLILRVPDKLHADRNWWSLHCFYPHPPSRCSIMTIANAVSPLAGMLCALEARSRPVPTLRLQGGPRR